MKAVAVRAALLLALPALTACEDGTGPEGEPSDFEVHVYVESDETIGYDPAVETGLEATVTVTSTFDDVVLVGQTGPDGIVTFPQVAAGGYTITHVLDDASDAVELQGSQTQTVVAPSAGDSVLTRFVYRPADGTIGGVVFRDENGTTFYEEGQDSVYRDVVLVLFAGEDTLGAAVGTDTTDVAGMYDFGERAAGEYRLVVREPDGVIVLGANPREVSVAPGVATFHAIEMIEDPAPVVITIAEARDSAVGDTVRVRGTVTAGQGVYRDDSFQIQDASSGVIAFGFLDDAVTLAEGDSVEVLAERWRFRQEVYLTVIAVEVLGTGELPLPRTVTTTQLNDGLFQGELATLTATVDSIRAGDGGGYEVWVHDASGDAQIFVDNDTEIAETEFTLGAEQTVTGVLGTFDADDDLVIEFGDHVLRPRSADDVN